MDGRPFFVVSCAVDPGLLSVLHDQIVPPLKADALHAFPDRFGDLYCAFASGAGQYDAASG
jgi:hypothetical protein